VTRYPLAMRGLPAVLVILVACKPTSNYSLAVGYTGALPAWNGPCDASTLDPVGIIDSQGGTYAVRKPGNVAIKCRDGTLRFDVRAPTTIVIDETGPLRHGSTHVLRAHVADADGDLDLGDTPVSWVLPTQLRETDHCSDMGYCASEQSIRVVADTKGDANVTAVFGALRTTKIFRVE
jgi:hypothetical protein